MKFLSRTIFVSVLAVLTSGCFLSRTGDGRIAPTLAANNPDHQLAVFNTNIYPIHKVVCDPFEPQEPGLNDGLVAELFYKKSGQGHLPNVNDYIQQAHASQQNFFFSSLHVPTRLFSLGFPKETGEMVQNDLGENLNEYFALRFKSVLKLTETDEEGEYELALLSDDGAVLKVKEENGQYVTYVDNDGEHPTRMGCGHKTIQMTKSSELMVEINYYQGPRYHIALTPLWRKVSAHNTPETSCGLTGNDTFFDYNNGSTPKRAYLDILNRGWKPIAAGNWKIPGTAIFNPCVPGTPPVITDFKLLKMEEGFLTFTWKTNIPATSQMYYKNANSGAEVTTESDNVLRTEHQVVVYMGAHLGQSFDFQGVSISQDYGKAISDKIRVDIGSFL